MSLNLWKLAGQPISYSPLPSGYPGVFLQIGDYKLVIKAKSVTSSILRLTAADGNKLKNLANGVSGGVNTTLSPVLTTYEINFNNSVPQNVQLNDLNSSNNIIIDSIELVQKPLPKLTINGIDGFLSGKWTLHANAQVVDDETLVLNATAMNQLSTIEFDVKANMDYTLTILGGLKDRRIYYYFDGTYKGSLADTQEQTAIKTEANTQKLKIALFSIGAGQFTFKRPMLNLGSIPAPYSKKTDPNAKMVMPVPKKNLFNKAAAIMDGNRINESTGLTYPNDGNGEGHTDYIPIKPYTSYVFSGVGNHAYIPWSIYDSNKNRLIGYGGDSNSRVIPNTYNAAFIRFSLFNDNLSTLQIEEGTTATPFTPYAVQVNKKPAKYVPKKNLFDGLFESGSIDSTTGLNSSGSAIRSVNIYPVKPNAVYTLSNNGNYTDQRMFYYDQNKNYISSANFVSTFTVPSNCYFVRFRILVTDLTVKAQLEEGSTATAFENFQLVLPKAKTGLSFNGVTDYLQLPSMTMDSIEIDCLIDSVQPNSGNNYIVDARTGLTNGYIRLIDTSLQGWGSLKLNGQSITNPSTQITRGQRIKLLIGANAPFTDDVTIFSFNTGGLANDKTKGTLYKVTCYLNNNIVAQYDFENPANQVGTTMMDGQAFNLIPSFDDSRWSLHANAQVLGKDYLRLNYTGQLQESSITVDVLPNTSYLFACGNSANNRYYVQERKTDNTVIGGNFRVNGNIITTSATTGKIRLNLTNSTDTSGTFDFIKPQLFQLDGKEGTLNGSPTRLNKASKRSLTAKR
jgi:hypothetical protein